MATPTDPLFSLQWHFDFLGDIQTIWDEYSGAGVTVAVYDDGVEYTHEDLDDNYDSSAHFEYLGDEYDPDPIAITDGHGTAVAGIIGAEWNSTGGVGVAWGSTIIGINYLEDIQNGYDSNLFSWSQADQDFYEAALSYAGEFDIMSNSWGSTPLYGSWQSLAEYENYGDTAILESIIANGRGGLGTVVVLASGNETLNLNGDGLNSLRETISVAATGSDGFITDYSNWGPGLLVSAPAASVTTDLSGEAGYNWASNSDDLTYAGIIDPTSDTDYTATFGGTSAATPVVSGVVALMLEANPDLGWRDVQNILAMTAAQTGSTMGDLGAGNEQSEWVTSDSNDSGSWNGGGLTYNLSYGFGMVDAFASVRMAEVWLDMIGDAQTSANEEIVSIDYSGSPIILADATSNSNGDEGLTYIDFTVTQDISIETVMLTVELDHDYGNDLTFGLIGPDGSFAPVFFNETGVNDDGNFDVAFMADDWTWTFHITGFLGYSSAGDWQLVFEDSAQFDQGTLIDYQVDFYGSEATDDSIHIVTNDFTEMTDYDSNRAVLSDTDGGTDWLNFVSVNPDSGNGDVTLAMSAGGAFSVDGSNWGSLAAGADVFENAVVGDGDDTVTGNDLDNIIMGMRGDDTLDGGAGDDTLEGGDGDDTLNITFNSTTSETKTARGENGRDTLQFYGLTSGLTVLGSYALANTSADRVNFETIDVLNASTFADTVTATGSVAEINTLAGDDAITLTGTGITLNLGAGDDTVDVNASTNTLDGGTDIDTASYGTVNSAAVTVSENGSELIIEYNNQSNSFVNFEFFEFSDGTYTAQQLLDLDAANTTTLTGDNTDETIDGTTTGTNNVINAGGGNDTIIGGGSNDEIFAGDGDDAVVDGLGDSSIYGGDGHDQIIALSGSNTIEGNDGNDFIMGGIAGDILSGGIGNDVLIGDPSALAMGASDTINGGIGDDLLQGGIGADTFVFTTNDGDNTIAQIDVSGLSLNGANLWSASAIGADFQSGIDVIHLDGFGSVNSSNVMSFVNDTTDGALFNADGTTILFYGVDAADLGSDDFVFV